MINMKEFIEKIVSFKTVDDILNDYKLQSDKGIIFERLFDIIIKFGFCDKFKNSEYFPGSAGVCMGGYRAWSLSLWRIWIWKDNCWFLQSK